MADFEHGVWWSGDGLRLHYRAYEGPDSKPPIVCLHGLTRNARDWEPVADRLAGDWRIFCLEMRGRGESAYADDAMTYVPLTYVRDVEAFAHESGIERFVAFGTSLGGIVAMLLAGARPERLAGALLNDIGPDIEPVGIEKIMGYVGKSAQFPTWMHAAFHLRAGFAAAYPDWRLEDWIGFAKRLCKLQPSGRITFDYDMRIAEPFRAPGGAGGVDLWTAFAGLKKVPTLLVRGERSDILSAETAAEMKRRHPELAVATVPNTGHAPVLDEPVAVAAIDALLARIATVVG